MNSSTLLGIPEGRIRQMIKPRGAASSTQELVKLRSDYLLHLTSMLSSISSPKEFGDFGAFKQEINKQIVSFFEKTGILAVHSESFVKAFSQENINVFLGAPEEKEELMKILVEKNILYRLSLFIFISHSKLDAILTPEDKDTLLRVIESDICTMFDTLYLGFHANLPTKEQLETIPKPPEDEKLFGGYVDGKPVPYNTFVDVEGFHQVATQLSCVPNSFIKECFLGVYGLIKDSVTDYKAWVTNEGKGELQSWADENSNLAMILAMEDYEIANRAIDPELTIMLKQKNTLGIKNATDLAAKYYGSSYGVEATQFYFAEPILASGDGGFGGPLGKNFPNDARLKKQHGTYVYYRQTGFNNLYANALPYLKKLIGDDFSPDRVKVRKFIDDHVEYHEYGHNLFIANHGSELEEAKPSLFHDLKLYDENLASPLESEAIRHIVDFLLVDMMRDFERHKNPQFAKYVTYSRLVLGSLFTTGILSWNNDKLVIDTSPKKYSEHLAFMKKVLEDIQGFYALDTENDATPSRQLIKEYIENINQTSKENFEKITTIMGTN